jgi:hypothetical protein
MEKVKTKTIYVNKELEKRMNAKDKAGAKAHKAKKKTDSITHIHKESSKSPKKMFKESMAHLHKLTNKKK